jgi:hypothetical protein
MFVENEAATADARLCYLSGFFSTTSGSASIPAQLKMTQNVPTRQLSFAYWTQARLSSSQLNHLAFPADMQSDVQG